MLLVAVPLLALLYAFAWKYRAGNKKAEYDPEQKHGALRELGLWVIPAVLILTLSIINWKSTHALDPYKPLAAAAKPLTIQVVALNWKWLFIYPEQGIATVNFIEFPAQTPLHFELTADAPVNSFWIPELGSQIYAMAGMTTQLNLMADAPGEFAGRAAEINGPGYAGMNFIAKAVSQADFDAWITAVERSSGTLDLATYRMLAAPSENDPASFYSHADKDLYDTIIMKFTAPPTGPTQTQR